MLHPDNINATVIILQNLKDKEDQDCADDFQQARWEVLLGCFSDLSFHVSHPDGAEGLSEFSQYDPQ